MQLVEPRRGPVRDGQEIELKKGSEKPLLPHLQGEILPLLISLPLTEI